MHFLCYVPNRRDWSFSVCFMSFVSFSSHEGLGKKNLRRMTMKVNLLNATGEVVRIALMAT